LINDLSTVIVGFFLFVTCQTVERIGLSKFIVGSESQELKLGEHAYQKLQASSTLRRATIGRRNCGRLASASQLPQINRKTWEFTVQQGKEVNAFALPGGKVAFWGGIMPHCSRPSSRRSFSRLIRATQEN